MFLIVKVFFGGIKGRCCEESRRGWRRCFRASLLAGTGDVRRRLLQAYRAALRLARARAASVGASQPAVQVPVAETVEPAGAEVFFDHY